MSHSVAMKVQFKQECEQDLLSALRQHFGADGVQVHDNKVPIKNWMGQPLSLKANIIVTKDALGKKLGHHVASNELGYERNKDGGYTAHVDTAGFPQEQAAILNQMYTEAVATRKLKAKGYAVQRKVLEDNRIRLTASRYVP